MADDKLIFREVVKKEATLEELKEQEKAVFITLDELNDVDFQKVKELIDSMDYDPIFLGHDAATCG